MAKARKIKFICRACRWFDRTYGNTYHSVRVTRVRDNAVIVAPLQYGYGEHYKQTALELIQKNKWIKTSKDDFLWKYERENNYPIHWEVSDGLKRDAVDNGIL